jgi:predicted GNAT family acetyltransferase
MTHTAIDIDVRDDRDTSRFLVDQDGSTAELTYMTEGRLILNHTEVPLCVEGRGIGAELVRVAVSRVRTEHLTLVPTCPFARRWLRDHPEATDG